MKEKVERLSRTTASYDIDRYMGQVTNRIKNFDKVMQRGDISEKKAMMRSFLHKIEVDPKAEKCYYYFRKCPITDNNSVGNGRIIKSDRTLTTIRNSHYCNDSVLKELCEIEVLDLSKRSTERSKEALVSV